MNLFKTDFLLILFNFRNCILPILNCIAINESRNYSNCKDTGWHADMLTCWHADMLTWHALSRQKTRSIIFLTENVALQTQKLNFKRGFQLAKKKCKCYHRLYYNGFCLIIVPIYFRETCSLRETLCVPLIYLSITTLPNSRHTTQYEVI